MTHYARGAYLERQVVEAFRGLGYVATRTAGSHGVADVWAAWHAGWGVDFAPRAASLVLVQCKATDKSLPGPKEWNALWDACVQAGALPVLAWREGKGRAARIVYRELTGPRRPRSRRATWPWREWTP